jgi:hypothetical protein
MNSFLRILETRRRSATPLRCVSYFADRRAGPGQCLQTGIAVLAGKGQWRSYALLIFSGALSACSASPSRNILGSYFPTWMICALLGLVCVVILRVVITKSGIDTALPAPVVVYLCAWLAITLTIWLVWQG